MTRTRLAGAAFASLLAVLAAAQPVAAQASTTSALINELNTKLLVVAIPITLLTEGILIYTIIRFRNNDEAKPTKENRRLEITWTVATAIVLLFVGVASYGVLANEDVTYTQSQGPNVEAGDVVVSVDAFQWNWNMSYPSEGITNLQGSQTDLTTASGPVIVIPEGQDVYFRITAQEVLHSFSVPELGLKQDAIPEQENTIKTVATETGEYQGYCTEYCGVGHSQMYFTVVVVSQEEYDSFVQAQTASDEQSTSGDSNATNASTSNASIAPAPADLRTAAA
jgi:cytochrome c oxidase subunit 2